MKFFDCCAYPGPPSGGASKPTLDDLLSVMDQYGIERAVVCPPDAASAAVGDWNATIREQTAAFGERLVPAFALSPAPLSPDGLQDEERALLRASQCAVRTYPTDCQFSLKEWQSAGMLDFVSAEGVPLILGLDQIQKGAGYDFDLLYEVLKRYPLMDIVVTGALEAAERSLLRLMSLFANLHVETSSLLWDGATQRFAEASSPERILFGTQAPNLSPAAPIEALDNSNLPEDAKELIAHGNFERIVLRPGV